MSLSLLEHLYAALHSERGVVVETDDVEHLRMKLYPLRKQHEEFAVLSFVISPTNPTTELWIVKARSPTDAQE